mmetsp:Transcript_9034/g.22043  ORF Transcript_9034/g.22043 Transcript_9034/m.22043 type:complete len:204 (+) Transcript_9034:3642-4253(+)
MVEKFLAQNTIAPLFQRLNFLALRLVLLERLTSIGQLRMQVGPQLGRLVVHPLNLLVADVIDHFELTRRVRQGASDDRADGLEVHGVQLHRAGSQPVDAFQELVEAGGVFGARPPEPEPAHEPEVLGLGYGRGTAIHDAGSGEQVLKFDDLRGRLGAGRALAHIRGLAVLVEVDRLGLVALVEHDETVEVFWVVPAAPLYQLF